MFKIAICDDDQILCDSVEETIKAGEGALLEEIYVVKYYSGDELCYSMGTGNSFDLIFLDIEMEGMDGVETGAKIRKVLSDTCVQIVYISSKQSYAMELFQNRPLDFLIKPVGTEKIMEIIKEVQRKKSVQSEYFEYKREKGVFRIRIKAILYLESQKKKVRIIFSDGQDEYYGSLNEAENRLLSNEQFIRIHKSYLVNYERVKKANRDQILMENGMLLTISRANQKQAMNRILEKMNGGEKA